MPENQTSTTPAGNGAAPAPTADNPGAHASPRGSAPAVDAANDPLRFGDWRAPDGTNVGMLRGARLLVIETIKEAGGAAQASQKYLAVSTGLGDHYTALALKSLEAEAKVMRYTSPAWEGKGTPPALYRLPSESERVMLAQRERVVAEVRAALPGANVSVRGVTADLMTIARALGIETE
jgi:hypothetical protein